MYLFEVSVTEMSNIENREVANSSMIGDMADLKDKRSVIEIMEKLGKLIIEFNSEKGTVE